MKNYINSINPIQSNTFSAEGLNVQSVSSTVTADGFWYNLGQYLPQFKMAEEVLSRFRVFKYTLFKVSLSPGG